MPPQPVNRDDLVRWLRMQAEQDHKARRDSAEADLVEPGAIARIAWNSNVVLVVLSGTGGSTVTGYPVEVGRSSVTLDQAIGPAETSLDASLQTNARPVTLPAIVLDTVVGHARLSPGDTVGAWLQRVARVNESHILTPSRGHREQRSPAAVQEILDAFQSLRAGQGNLGALLRERHVTVTNIAQSLHLESAPALSVARGEQPLTPEQAVVLEGTTGIRSEELLAARSPFPEELVDSLSAARYRRAILAQRDRGTTDESQAFEHVALRVLQTAARSDPRAGTSWMHRIDRYLEGVGL